MADQIPPTKASAKLLDYVGLGLVLMLMPIEAIGPDFINQKQISTEEWLRAGFLVFCGLVPLAVGIWWENVKPGSGGVRLAPLEAIARNPLTWLIVTGVIVLGVPAAIGRTSPTTFAGLIIAFAVMVGLMWVFFRPVAAPVSVQKEAQPAAAAEKTETAISADALYVGNMHASTTSLAAEFFIDIEIRAFNGTGTAVAVTELQGSIKTGPNVALPPPRIKEEVFRVRSIQRAAEFYVTLEQHIPRAIAERMAQAIDAGDSVGMELNDLNIFVSPTDNHNQKVRLPLWNGITIRKYQDYIVTGRIIQASGRIGR